MSSLSFLFGFGWGLVDGILQSLARCMPHRDVNLTIHLKQDPLPPPPAPETSRPFLWRVDDPNEEFVDRICYRDGTPKEWFQWAYKAKEPPESPPYISPRKH
jgi:hypothetical protein